jgi:hypothetical protein
MRTTIIRTTIYIWWGSILGNGAFALLFTFVFAGFAANEGSTFVLAANATGRLGVGAAILYYLHIFT